VSDRAGGDLARRAGTAERALDQGVLPDSDLDGLVVPSMRGRRRLCRPLHARFPKHLDEVAPSNHGPVIRAAIRASTRRAVAGASVPHARRSDSRARNAFTAGTLTDARTFLRWTVVARRTRLIAPGLWSLSSSRLHRSGRRILRTGLAVLLPRQVDLKGLLVFSQKPSGGRTGPEITGWRSSLPVPAQAELAITANGADARGIDT